MEETIQWLKQFMNNRKLGNEVSNEYLEMVNALIECSIKLNVENQQYKQQIDELIKKYEQNKNEATKLMEIAQQASKDTFGENNRNCS